jgi:hypothetical protein
MSEDDSIQEESRLPDREKRTKDVKGSSKSKKVSQVKCKGLVYGVFEMSQTKCMPTPRGSSTSPKMFQSLWIGFKERWKVKSKSEKHKRRQQSLDLLQDT